MTNIILVNILVIILNFDLKEAFLIFIRGILMGSADIVPGVSGGTIALITGIYAHLIEAISKIKFGFLKPNKIQSSPKIPSTFFSTKSLYASG